MYLSIGGEPNLDGGGSPSYSLDEITKDMIRY